ncbi:unnamed protein product [Peniophora sp. CBMAI 1063]|nr:unnamed protein product [Peniophora sp. CBMAI 1063]
MPSLTVVSNSAPDSGTVNLLLAPDFVGNFLGWFLYGLLVLQTYHYRRKSRHDHPSIRMTVWGIFVLETALTVITTRVTYTLLCNGWGDPDALRRLSRLDAFIPAIGGLVSGWTQTFYAWRIYKLTRSEMWEQERRPWRCVPALVMLLMGTSTGTALYCGFGTINFTDVASLMNIQSRLIVWLVTSVLCDAIVALSLIYILHRMNRLLSLPKEFEIHESPLEGRIKSIILMSLETCLLTTISTIAMLVLFVVLPQSRLPTMMGFITSKLYSNSLLVSLNSKHHWAARVAGRNSTFSALEPFAAAAPRRRETNTSVTVEVEVPVDDKPYKRAD